jgi:hypothetical protein
MRVKETVSMPERGSQRHYRQKWIVVLREAGLFMYRAAPFVAAAGAVYAALKR